MSDYVLLDKRSDGVGLITLNRPDRLNALGLDVQYHLADCLERCAKDREIRAVVLTGAGRGFCAGGDVKGDANLVVPPNSWEALSPTPAGLGSYYQPASTGGAPSPAAQSFSLVGEMDMRVAALRERQMRISYVLHTMPKPTIAMVNGPAAGGGFSLALACDLRIASERATFVTAYSKLGISGDYGGTYFLTKLVGPAKALELYFTSEKFGAETAHQLGLVNRVVPHDKLEEETLALAANLAAGPTTAYAHIKENIDLAQHADLKALLDQEALNVRLCLLTDDSKEAIQAARESRQPKFTGA